MEKCYRIKMLITAQPFGFGPASAASLFFRHLRPHIQTLAYIGVGHTLDLHKGLGYDAVYICGTDTEAEKKRFCDICNEYDVMLTVCDFVAATIAKEICKKRTIMYDPIPWFWLDIPKILSSMDLYLAQNFFGVNEHITTHHDHFPQNTIILPALTPCNLHETDLIPEDLLLINFGGLSNPVMSDNFVVWFRSYCFKSI